MVLFWVFDVHTKTIHHYKMQGIMFKLN